MAELEFPYPPCRTCRHWEDPPDPDDYDPEWGASRRCDLYETFVMRPDFGCKEWEKKE